MSGSLPIDKPAKVITIDFEGRGSDFTLPPSLCRDLGKLEIAKQHTFVDRQMNHKIVLVPVVADFNESGRCESAVWPSLISINDSITPEHVDELRAALAAAKTAREKAEDLWNESTRLVDRMKTEQVSKKVAGCVQRAMENVAHTVNEIRGEMLEVSLKGDTVHIILPTDCWEELETVLKEWKVASEAFLQVVGLNETG